MNTKRSHGVDLHREKNYSVPYEDLSTIEKRRRTNLEKYGVDNVHKVNSIKEQTKKTNLEKYGVENPMQNKDIAKKSAEIRHEHIDEIEKKIKQTWLDKYGADNPSKVPEILDKIQDKRKAKMPELMKNMSNTMIERYGVPYYVMADDCKENQGQIISKTNRDFGNLLKQHGIPYKFEFRIDNRSYDIHLLDTNILIEIDPSYTHSVNGNHFNPSGIDKNYHLYKTLLAEVNGYHCIHVFDWDDQDKIVEYLMPRKKIDAESCQIWRLNKNVGDKFLNENDLQGTCRNQLLYLGLVRDGEIYQVMTFGKSIYNKHYNIVLRRMTTKFGFEVVGGYNKLLHYASEVLELYSIVVYSDISKYPRSIYENLDMMFVKKNAPRKIWSKDNKYMTDYTMKRFKQYDNDSDWVEMYDCGVNVFEY